MLYVILATDGLGETNAQDRFFRAQKQAQSFRLVRRDADAHDALFACHTLDLPTEDQRAQEAIEDLAANRRPQCHVRAPYGQNNYRTLGASGVRRVAASPLTFFMKNRLIVFERAAAANARLSNRARQ